MKLASHLPAGDRERVEARLRSNLMAWLTTVRPDGQPVSVPVWFLVREDESILVYSQPGKGKLRNIAQNPKVSLGLDSGCTPPQTATANSPVGRKATPPTTESKVTDCTAVGKARAKVPADLPQPPAAIFLPSVLKAND